MMIIMNKLCFNFGCTCNNFSAKGRRTPLDITATVTTCML